MTASTRPQSRARAVASQGRHFRPCRGVRRLAHGTLMARSWAPSAAAWALILWSNAAVASAPDHTKWYAPVGASLGAAFHPEGSTGIALGAEASLVALEVVEQKWFSLPRFWRGGYLDVVYDRQAGRGRVSAGPEIGYACVGLDAGLVTQLGGAGTHVGFAIRPILTFGWIAAYLRVGFVPGDATVSRFTELGLLFKWPIELP